METFPQHLLDMARRRPPNVNEIVQGSSPVIAFGNLLTARAATLSINPSSKEFCKKGGSPLLGPDEKRLVDRETLGVQDQEKLTEHHAEKILKGCFTYFDGPSYQWFDVLEDLLQPHGFSYRRGTMCHLDLVQWSTFPAWGKIDENVKETLLDEGLPLLEELIVKSEIDVIIVNGRSIWDQLTKLGNVEVLEKVKHALPGSSTTISTLIGHGFNRTFVGWSAHLQRMRVSSESRGHAARIASDWIQEQLGNQPGGNLLDHVRPRNSANAPQIVDGFIQEGVVNGWGELVNLLTTWTATSTRRTIGDVQSYGRRALVRIRLKDGQFANLNADTSRQGVISALSSDPIQNPDWWRVIGNRNGVFNKVIPGAATSSIPGWYCYLTQPETGEIDV